MTRGTTLVRCAFLLCALPIASAHAQIESGQIVDDSIHMPLQHTVVSLHELRDGKWQLVDSAKTDERGLFQFKPTEPGIFRVGVLGTVQPQFTGAIDTLAADSVNERMLMVPMLRWVRSRVFFNFQVEKPAAIFDPWQKPTYPAQLRAKRVEGDVYAQFVVNTNGTVDMGTFKVLRTAEPEFVDAVRKFLLSARYYPATINDKPVRQIVQQQFMFNLM